jgi:ABC-type antimicrobial peptide transport system permease subunit
MGASGSISAAARVTAGVIAFRGSAERISNVTREFSRSGCCRHGRYMVGGTIASLLYGVKARDPISFLAALLLMGGAALAASWIPAFRASRIDPIVALRSE